MNQPVRQNRSKIAALAALTLAAFVGWEIIEFTVNRIYVPVGKSYLLQYKGPLVFGSRKTPAPGHLADLNKGEIGVVDQMLGPGRHFYCPLWWTGRFVDDQIVKPGEVAVVTSLVGKDLSQRPRSDGQPAAGADS